MSGRIERGAHVIGAGNERCVGHFVYLSTGGEYILAGDDRDGEPVAVVDRFLSANQVDIAPITERQLAGWAKKWRGR